MSHKKNLFGIALDREIGDRPRGRLLEARAMTRPMKHFDLRGDNGSIGAAAVVIAE